MKLRPLVGVALAAAATTAFVIGCDSGTSNPSPKSVAAVNSSGFISSATAPGGINSVGSFTTVSPMSQGARAGHTANVLPSGNVIVIGGQNQAGPNPGSLQQESEIYDPTADTWTVVATLHNDPNDGRLIDPTGNFATARIYHTAISTTNGAIVVAGGLGVERLNGPNPIFEAMETTYTFDPLTNKFAWAGGSSNLNDRRYFHQGTLTATGQVLVVCGWDVFDTGNPTAKVALQSAETFDLSGASWSPVQPRQNAVIAGHTYGNTVRFGQNVLTINGGLFDYAASQQPPPTLLTVNAITPAAVVIGSPNSQGKFSSGGEIYNATTGQYGTGPTSTRTQGTRGVMLAAGVTLGSTNVTVLAGGEDLGPSLDTRFSNLSSTELLDLATQQFVAGPNMNSSAPAQANGQPAPPLAVTQLEASEIGRSSDVLLIGGIALVNNQPAANDQCEIYDTLNNVMKNILQLQEGRYDHRVVQLSGNQILVIGGRNDPAMDTPTDSVELYNR